MSLLSVTVKRAKFVGPNANQLNTYVTLQLQNVKSTTITVKGANPAWEQDFLFETNCLDTGLLIEVWNKGLIWDKAMGHYWLPLHQVPYSNEEGTGQWMSLDAEQIMENGVVVGTRNPTGDYLLIDCRFEMPYDSEDVDCGGMQRKLEAYNHVLDQEMATLRDVGKRRQQQFLIHSGLSEDSDYTSEVNYPLAQHHEANGSASQYLSVAHQYPSPQRSSEISRENSYETNDTSTDQRHWAYDYGGGGYPAQEDGYDYNYDQSEEMYLQGDQWPRPTEEPLYYNSRPSKESKSSGQYNTSSSHYESSDRRLGSITEARSTIIKGQKPSLERQSTLYDEHETNAAEVTYHHDYDDYQQPSSQQVQHQSYPIGNNKDQEEQYNYTSTAGYDDYSTYQQYDGGGEGIEYDYNYDYNYGYSEGQQVYNADGSVIDDGKESHGYGYYDDTGYYYDGQWYSYDANQYDANYDGTYSTEDAASNWSQTNYDGQEYDYSEYPAQTVPSDYLPSDQPVPSQQQKNQTKSSGQQRLDSQDIPLTPSKQQPQQLVDLYSKRRTMMHHGDLSSSGGSVESEQPVLRRGESIASVTTPTGPEESMDYHGMRSESPLVMMGELDRLQTDLLIHQRRMSTSSAQDDTTITNDYRAGSGLAVVEQPDHRRGSIQSRLSQMSQQSRRERAEHFRRRRSSSICSDRDRDREHTSPYNGSYEDERTPVNEMNLSMEMNDMTPVATHVPFPSQQQQYKSVSFEEDDPHMYDHHHHDETNHEMPVMDKLEPQHLQPETPGQNSVISAPPQQPTERPCQNLTPRQKWLWAFNKICAQLMVSPESKLIKSLNLFIVRLSGICHRLIVIIVTGTGCFGLY